MSRLNVKTVIRHSRLEKILHMAKSNHDDEEKVPRLDMVVKREEAIGEIVHSQKVPILSRGQLGRVCVRHDRRLTLGRLCAQIRHIASHF